MPQSINNYEVDTTHPTETMSLASLPGLRHPDFEGNSFNDCASYYSLSELSETDPVRRVAAVEVRRQALAFPPQPKLGCRYPKLFQNHEQLPLRASAPWLEYPLLATGRYISGEPGPARVVVNVYGFTGLDVIYHPRRSRRDFKVANYRPKGYQRAFLSHFVTEYETPLYQSMTLNAYPISSHEEYSAYHGFEWQGQELGQAPWLVPSHMAAQPYYGIPMQPRYETYNPYMAAPMPYSFYQCPVFHLSEFKSREH